MDIGGKEDFMIEWSDDFSLDDALMDEQHKKIFALIKRVTLLVESMNTSEDITSAHKKDLKESLLILINYVSTHFKDEENYMAKIRFPLLKSHAKRHKELSLAVKDLLQFASDPNALAKELLKLAEIIVYDHILTDDLLVASFSKQAFGLNEIHQSLELYTKIKTYKGQGGNKTFTYICACRLKEIQIIDAIHEELQNGYIMRCPVCRCPYVYLGKKDDEVLLGLLQDFKNQAEK